MPAFARLRRAAERTRNKLFDLAFQIAFNFDHVADVTLQIAVIVEPIEDSSDCARRADGVWQHGSFGGTLPNWLAGHVGQEVASSVAANEAARKLDVLALSRGGTRWRERKQRYGCRERRCE